MASTNPDFIKNDKEGESEGNPNIQASSDFITVVEEGETSRQEEPSKNKDDHTLYRHVPERYLRPEKAQVTNLVGERREEEEDSSSTSESEEEEVVDSGNIDEGSSNRMDKDLYSCCLTGDLNKLKQNAGDLEQNVIAQTDAQGRNMLHLAAGRGHNHLVEEIVRSHPELLSRTDKIGNLPLHVAAERGYLETVKSLLPFTNLTTRELNGMLTKVNKCMNSPLHEALEHEQIDVARFLISVGGEGVKYTRNRRNKTPFYLAAEKGYNELVNAYPVSAMDTDELDQHPVYAAISSKSAETLKTVLDKYPVNAEVFDKRGRTPLSRASSIGFLDGVVLLLEHPNDQRHVSNRSGAYPIHEAAKKGHGAVVAAFLARYPDTMCLLDKERRTFLHIAAERGRETVVQIGLRTPGIEDVLDKRDKKGHSVLHSAAYYWHPDIVRLMTLDGRIKKDAPNRKNQTALDVVESRVSRTRAATLRENLTWDALFLAQVPRRRLINSEPFDIPLDQLTSMFTPMSVVAVLGATAAYSSFYTVPGGLESEGEHKGTAIFTGNAQFMLFALFNVIAFLTNILASILLIFCYVNDSNLMSSFGRWSGFLMAVGISSFLAEVMTGVPICLRGLSTLVSWVTRMGCGVGILLMPLVYILLFYPDPLSHGPVARRLGGAAFRVKLRWYKIHKKKVQACLSNSEK